MMSLAIAAWFAGDLDEAARLARQAGQIPDIPPKAARECGYLLASVLTDAGDLPGAEQTCATALTLALDAGDLDSLAKLLPVMADLDLRACRAGDAAAHLREATQIALQAGMWFTMLRVLNGCGHLCAATERPADAVTAWTAGETLERQGGLRITETDTTQPGTTPCARPGGHSDRPGTRGGRTRRGDEPGHCGRVRADADRPRSAAAADMSGPGKLSARERELVTLVAQGRTDADIAAHCTSASAPSARTWTGSGTRPAAAAAPT